MTENVLATVKTGVPGLDQVLGGGLWQGCLYLLEGLPGTGKTILANQVAFGKAAAGEKVLYVSLISESHGKLIHHLRSMRFFAEARVGTGVYYVSGYRSMVDKGLEGFLDFIIGETRGKAYSLVVVEGFSGTEYVKNSLIDLAQFLHRLNSLAVTLRCTVLLVSHDQGTVDHPEHTLVDGVMELTRSEYGMRVARFLKIHKIRGRDPILGEHEFSITSDGVRIHPRLEAVVTRESTQAQPPPTPAQARVAFGVRGLDAMLGGGLVAGGTTVILGTPGAGKTLLAASFAAEGLRRGERVLFFGMYEAPQRLVDKASSVGLDLASGMAQGQLRILWRPPLEYSLDELAWTLLHAVEGHRPRRVIIDGIKGFLQAALQRESLSMFLTALTSRLRAAGVDTLITEELPLAQFGPEEAPHLLSPVVENALLLRHFEVRGGATRFVSLLKVRESEYDTALRELVISSRGLEVRESPRDALAATEDRSQR